MIIQISFDLTIFKKIILSLLNKIVNKFLLVGDKYMPEMDLKQPRFKNKERIKHLNKQEILIIFIKMNLIKHVLNMIWHMEILKIYKKKKL